MRILLDENMPHRLRALLLGHDVHTTAYQGWAGLTNGVLLKAADEAGFEAMITADQGIRYQQNRTNYRLALIVLSSNKEALIVANIDAIQEALRAAGVGALVFCRPGNVSSSTAFPSLAEQLPEARKRCPRS
jgi:predicted nuclease of predicted toxin-antitoxin system